LNERLLIQMSNLIIRVEFKGDRKPSRRATKLARAVSERLLRRAAALSGQGVVSLAAIEYIIENNL